MNEPTETEKIWEWCSTTSAHLQAMQTVLIALAAAQQRNPAFHSALMAAHNSYMAGNLNQPAFDDRFIQAYQAHVAALVPENVRQLLQ